MSWERMRWLVLILMLVGLIWAGRNSIGRIAELRRVEKVCSATAEGQWTRAVELSQQLEIAGEASLRALECRCRALLELGSMEACGRELAETLQKPEANRWLPSPSLVAVAVNYLMDRGELASAAQLALRGAREYGDMPLLLTQEFLLRSQLEDETLVLAEMESRLSGLGQDGNELAYLLITRYLLRQQWERAAAILEAVRPLPEQVDTWFELDTEIRASMGDVVALRQSLDHWRQEGGNSADLQARYAYLLSVKGLADPDATRLELLERAVALDDEIENRQLATAVRGRLIRYMAFLGRHDEAIRLYDRSVQKYGVVAGVTRTELQSSATQRSMEELANDGTAPRGSLIFSGGLLGGDTLWVSPDGALAVDAPFEAYPVAGNSKIKVSRSLGKAPVRWVLRQESEEVVASGSIWIEPGRARLVEIERRRPASKVTWSASAGTEADGRRRLVLLVLDGADWRLVRYLGARGEMPVLKSLAEIGTRGVLLSDPPFTAAALRAMVYPEETVVSFPGLLFQLGEEIEALNFVGRNPVGFLAGVLPGADNLFEALGRGDLALVNLLRSKGAIQAGRHAQVTGPKGQAHELSGYRSSRPVSEMELDRVPGLVGDPETAGSLMQEIAADFDTVITLIENGGADVVALRVAALDILTHAHYGPLMTSDQDDGERTLLRIYSYIDSRLAEVTSSLDQDDVLVVMSDHGIRNSLEHDPNCLFVAVGPGLQGGRLEGRPTLRGTGRMVADLFSADTGWPATGMESWVGDLLSP